MINPRTGSGSVVGGILLVAGSCIGAAMLGLPVLTGCAGFIPAQVMFLVAWVYMVATGLLLLEVNLWYGGHVSIISMVQNTLGKFGASVAWVTYALLFYAIMIALIAGSGAICSNYLSHYLGLSLSPEASGIVITALFGLLVWKGTRDVDYLNRILMIGLVVFYVLLVAVGSLYVDSELLGRQNWGSAVFVLPVMVISFGFHNLIPSLTMYFQQEAKPIKQSIIIGSAISFLVYLVWQWIVLGIVPVEGESGLLHAMDHGHVATLALRDASGNAAVVQFADVFGLFAMTTTFLGVALGFVDFLADGLHVKENTGWTKVGICCLVLVPPLVFASLDPSIFLRALSYAGGFGAVILFGVLPALMAWQGRYRQKIQGRRLLPGGKPVLVLVIVASFVMVGLVILNELAYVPSC